MKDPEEKSIYFDGRHYDAWVGEVSNSMLAFFLSHANEAQGSILDLACGTGRLTIPIAEEGLLISGLDFSEPMLDSAKATAKAKGLQIEWIHGDMMNFNLNKEFPLILMVGRAFAHLESLENVEDCLSCVHKHLTKNGRFIFEVFNPNLAILTRDPSKRYPVAEYPDPDGKGTVNITENNRYDRASQVNRVKMYYEIGEEKITRELNVRIFYPQELDALLRYNGFTIKAKYGSYEKEPFTSDSGDQIFVCRKEAKEV